MLKRLAFLYRVPAVAFATLFLLAGAYFGSSRDFGSFLLTIPALGILFLGAIVATVWAACIRSERGRATVALVLIGLTPLAYLCSYGMAQESASCFGYPLTIANWCKRRRRTGSSRAGIVGAWQARTPSPTWSSTHRTDSDRRLGPISGPSGSVRLAACGTSRGCGQNSTL